MGTAAFFFYLSLISSSVCFFYGINLGRKSVTNLFLLLVLSSAAADFVNETNTQIYLNFGYNLGLVHAGVTYRIIEFSILSLLLTKTLILPKVANFLIYGGILLFPCWFLISSDFLSSGYDYTLVRLTSASVAILMVLAFFKKTITKMEIPNIETWPPLYLMGGLFLYFSGVLIIFFLHRPIALLNIQLGNYLWAFHNGLVVLRNVLFFVGFYFTYKYNIKWS